MQRYAVPVGTSNRGSKDGGAPADVTAPPVLEGGGAFERGPDEWSPETGELIFFQIDNRGLDDACAVDLEIA